MTASFPAVPGARLASTAGAPERRTAQQDVVAAASNDAVEADHVLVPETPADPGRGGQLFDVYKQALDEVHFQVTFNWTRIQQLLVSDGVILAAAVGLYTHAGRFTALLFGLGFFVSVGALNVNQVQHAYYRRTRDRVARLEDALQLPTGQRLNSTGTQSDRLRDEGDERGHPKVSVTVVITALFAAIAVADVVGIVAALR